MNRISPLSPSLSEAVFGPGLGALAAGLTINVVPLEPKLPQHRTEQSGPDILASVLDRREPVAVVQPAVAAFSMTGLEAYRNTAHPARFSYRLDKITSLPEQEE